METVQVNVRRSSDRSDVETDLATAKVLARMMDAQFELGTVKFGLDAVLGLVPVIGDLASMTVGMYPIYLARKHGLSRTVILRMWANLAIDFAAGVVPVVGDVADVMLKANLKNVELLEKHVRRKYALLK